MFWVSWNSTGMWMNYVEKRYNKGTHWKLRIITENFLGSCTLWQLFYKTIGKNEWEKRNLRSSSVLGFCFYSLFRVLEALKGSRSEANELLAFRPQPIPRGDCWIISHMARRDNVIHRQKSFSCFQQSY